MPAVKQWESIPEDDYLQGELVSKQKHEYLGGVVYAMAGGTNRHNLIAGNVFVTLHNHLRDSPCQAFNSDTKVRIRSSEGTRYYYPDAMIVCRPNPESDTFQDEPSAIIEVLSESTRRTDESEKKDAYVRIPSLNTYIMVETDAPAAIVWQRTPQGFERHVFHEIGTSIPLSEVSIDLPLADIYEGITFDNR